MISFKTGFIVCFCIILIILLVGIALLIVIIVQLSNSGITSNSIVTNSLITNTILPKNPEIGLNVDGVIIQNQSISATNLDSRQFWYPTIGDGTCNFTTSYSKGGYSQVGNLYFITLTIIWTNFGNANSSLPVQISLPFTILNVDPTFSISFSIGQASNITYNGTLVAAGDAGTNFIYLTFISPNNSSKVKLIVANLSPNGSITISGAVPTQ